MSRDRNRLPKNKEGRNHGYCERYWRGNINWKGMMFNGHRYGYHESYDFNVCIDEKSTGYYLGGVFAGSRVSRHNKDGNCYIWKKAEL